MPRPWLRKPKLTSEASSPCWRLLRIQPAHVAIFARWFHKFPEDCGLALAACRFMMLVAVMMKLKKPAPTSTETKPGSSSSHAEQPPPPPPPTAS